MDKKKGLLPAILSSLCLVVLVLDTKTAVEGAKEGIALCTRSILPSLLPFCILSKLICAFVLGNDLKLMHPIEKLTGMPKGAGSILLLSFIGGYPVGAQCINDAYIKGNITQKDATRMLTFCNNAGPAFLFGILSCLFPNTIPLWGLYIVHIISALAVGYILPNKSNCICTLSSKPAPTLSQVVEQCMKTLGLICGWVIIFRIILQFIERWFLWTLDPIRQALIAGILELSNGCLALQQVSNSGLRYILCAFFLSFGGCCVTMQTAAVAGHIRSKLYFPGKLLQALLSVLLAAVTQFFLFKKEDCCLEALLFISIGLIIAILCTVIAYKNKKVVAFTK